MVQFVDDLSRLPDLDELPIVDRVGPEEFWQDVGIIVISIGVDFETISECRETNSLCDLREHLPTGLLCPFADGKCYEEIGFALDAGVRPRIAFAISRRAFGLNFFLFFLTVVQNSSTS